MLQAPLSVIESERKVTFQCMDSQKTLGERIRYIRKGHGLSQQQFGKILGVERGAVGNWELGKGIKSENQRQISQKFHVTLDWLMNGDAELPQMPSNRELFPRFRVSHHGLEEPVPIQPAPPAGAVELGSTVPLMRQGRAGKDGQFGFTREQAADVPAPPAIARVRDAYAVYVVGESMQPRYDPGEIVFVDPNRPVNPGHYVVAQIAGEGGEGPVGYIKRFLGRDSRQLRLEQFNPKKILTFPLKSVISVDRILMSGDG